MKLLIIGFVFSLNLFGQEPNFVKEFHVVRGEKNESKFIKKYRNSKNPDVLAYVVALEMKKAEYNLLPWTKLSIFNKSKEKLETLIDKHHNNIHLAYMRLYIQEKLPSILEYNSSIKKDKNFVKSFLDKKDSTDYLDKYIIKNTSL